jgi:regulator of sigma E protease
VITLASIGKVITFLVMLSILVVLHEFGHFIVARRNGVRVNEFAVGMGPKLAGWTSPRSGTLYTLRALPIGGFCAMEGEDGKSSEAEQQREFLADASQNERRASSVNFQAKSPWQRLAIVLAGPIANFILAYLILLIGAVVFGVPSDKPTAVIGLVTDNSPASKAGLHVGDRILTIDGKSMSDGDRVIAKLHASKGKTLALAYRRGESTQTTTVTPGDCPPSVSKEYGCIGISPIFAYARIPLQSAIVDSGEEFVNIADSTVGSLGLLVTHFTKYAGQVSGPVGMGQAAGVVQDLGWGPYFVLAATISFALGLFNLLPIPALDGGRAAFIIAELVRGKPVDPEKEAVVHIAGFAALMALMLLVAFHDIARIVSGKGVF